MKRGLQDVLPKRITSNRARSRGLLARVQIQTKIVLVVERGLKARGYVLASHDSHGRQRYRVTTDVCTFEGSPDSVQATTISLPESAILGKPPEAALRVPEAFTGAAAVPFAATWRICTCGPSLSVRSIQLTMASPDGRLKISTLPAGLPSSIRTFFPNVFPESEDITKFTCGFSPGAVNQATARFFPDDDTAGPLIGQPSIFHPSLLRVSAVLHFPFENRVIEMSRISLSDRSR